MYVQVGLVSVVDMDPNHTLPNLTDFGELRLNRVHYHFL
jgi:hypothetical protein